jgi:hypothetical protein
MRWLGVAVLVSALVAFHSAQMLSQKVIVVGSSGELRSSILNAKPGTKILLKPGEYEGGLFLPKCQGRAEQPNSHLRFRPNQTACHQRRR